MLCNKIYVSSTSQENAKLCSQMVVPIYTSTSSVQRVLMASHPCQYLLVSDVLICLLCFKDICTVAFHCDFNFPFPDY